MRALAERTRSLGGLPGQFWVLLGGAFLNSFGGSMVWPFITIYVYERLHSSLLAVGLLSALIFQRMVRREAAPRRRSEVVGG